MDVSGQPVYRDVYGDCVVDDWLWYSVLQMLVEHVPVCGFFLLLFGMCETVSSNCVGGLLSPYNLLGKEDYAVAFG